MGTWASANLALPEPTALPCAGCGYDLRAQPREGICPECAAPVQKAIELAAIPVRPAWRDSDPRWRRRMIAGAWIMVLIPLVQLALLARLTERIPVAFYVFRGFDLDVGTLDQSLVWFWFPYLPFCIGVVLFFSKERFRRPYPSDWTRRWGVITSYLVLLLGFVLYSTVTGLVLVGIAALFYSLPYANQPGVTELVRKLGTGYLYFDPTSAELAYAAAAVASACAVLLASVQIWDALRSSGPRRIGLILLALLAVISVSQMWSGVSWYLFPPLAGYEPPAFFFNDQLIWSFRYGTQGVSRVSLYLDVAREAAKWLIFLMIAIWLSIAQVRAWRKAPASKAAAT